MSFSERTHLRNHIHDTCIACSKRLQKVVEAERVKWNKTVMLDSFTDTL